MKVDQQFPVSGWGVGGPNNGNRTRKNSDGSVKGDQEDGNSKNSVENLYEDRVTIAAKSDLSSANTGLTMERARELADETVNALETDPQAAMAAQANLNLHSVLLLLE